MSYYLDQHYGPEPRAMLRKTLERDSMEREITRTREDIGQMTAYLIEAESQLERIKNTPLKWFVDFRCGKNHATGHINLTIHAFQPPDIPDAEKNAMRIYEYHPGPDKDKGSMNNPFLGNEKKAAVQKALAVAAAHGNCPIIGTGAGLLPKQQEIVML